MVFSSITFLCVFLPCVFLLNCIIPSVKVKNALLLIASLIFYAYGEPVYVLVLIGSSILNYIFALLINKAEKKKILLFLIVLVNIGVLCAFKYVPFAVETVNSLLKLNIPVPHITMPIGISFFTFQALSYVIDVYKGECDVQKNYFKLLLYISFFPQLIAGPIVKYKDICKEIDSRKIDLNEAAAGFRRFIFGLSKKVIIANTMAVCADSIFSAESFQINAASAWLGAIAYLMQIYFDFSGYSDMAIGMGKIFGFHFKENFNYPYGSSSVKEFWRRWHISLSSWFKEYLYIPLGGNRKGKARTNINKIIVFFCTGFWHGANWTFVLWGLYHGAFLMIEDIIPVFKKLPKIIGHVYTLIVVTVGFVIFRADSIAQGFMIIGNMFSDFTMTNGALSLLTQNFTPWFILCGVIALLTCAPLHGIANKLKLIPDGENKGTAVSLVSFCAYVLSFVLLAVCIIRLSGSAYNPFIYFRF